MTKTPFESLRDQMLSAPDECNEMNLPPRFTEARTELRETLKRLEQNGVPNETIVTLMLSEMLPRMVFERGPVATAAILGKLAHNIGDGVAPNTTRQ